MHFRFTPLCLLRHAYGSVDNAGPSVPTSASRSALFDNGWEGLIKVDSSRNEPSNIIICKKLRAQLPATAASWRACWVSNSRQPDDILCWGVLQGLQACTIHTIALIIASDIRVLYNGAVSMRAENLLDTRLLCRGW